LDAQLRAIASLHSDILNFPDPTEAQKDLETVVASTTTLINGIKSSLDGLIDDARKGGPNAQRKLTLINSQRTRLGERVHEYQRIEKQYRDRLRERTIAQFKLVHPEWSAEELAIALSNPQTDVFQKALMASTRHSRARSALQEVHNRHNEILEIEKKVGDLATLFNELNIMIDLQEKVVDQIDQDTQKTKVTMEDGNKHISRTKGYLVALRRKKWWCLLVVLLIIAVVVIVVVVTQVVNKNNSSNGGSSTSSPPATVTSTAVVSRIT